MTDRGFVYLVGAGPGDPKLLTLRALEVLQAADVVAHDELVPAAILDLLPAHVERLRVGRRHGAGKAAYRLHPAVLERARAGAVVARLKSGDPLIFGRGGEEAEELAEAGIPYEIVPGVSAALGAAARARIPLTHRRHAARVTFVTGHDVEALGSAAGETLVLFMAAHKLRANLERLISAGRSRSLPAAYVASATTPEQRVVVGTLGDLDEKVDGIDGSAPALIIVGDVVALRERIAGGNGPTPGGSREEASPGESRTASEGDDGTMRRGLLLVYTGHGKGKTTAALGLVFRALGRGLRVGAVQFIKGKWKTGERLFAEGMPNLDFHVMGQGFTWESEDLSRDRRAAREAWEKARALMSGGGHDVVVLDELTYCIHYGFLSLDEVLTALRARPAHVHVVVTGRNAPEEIVAIADLVTEMKAVKHPFEKGMRAQPGIDF